MIKKQSLSVWRKQFAAEYLCRVGITIEDGGADGVVENYFSDSFTPAEAVEREIEKYDLADMSNMFGWM